MQGVFSDLKRFSHIHQCKTEQVLSLPLAGVEPSFVFDGQADSPDLILYSALRQDVIISIEKIGFQYLILTEFCHQTAVNDQLPEATPEQIIIALHGSPKRFNFADVIGCHYL